jgi:hypothetical protein
VSIGSITWNDMITEKSFIYLYAFNIQIYTHHFLPE